MCLGVLSAYMFGHYMYAMSEVARRGVESATVGVTYSCDLYGGARNPIRGVWK